MILVVWYYEKKLMCSLFTIYKQISLKNPLNAQHNFKIKIKQTTIIFIFSCYHCKPWQSWVKNKDFSFREVTEMEIENGCN